MRTPPRRKIFAEERKDLFAPCINSYREEYKFTATMHKEQHAINLLHVSF